MVEEEEEELGGGGGGWCLTDVEFVHVGRVWGKKEKRNASQF